MNAPRFTIIPNHAWNDKRLTFVQLRVLGALFSFRDPRQSDTVFPSRRLIADRCGMPECKVSEATAALERFGWIKKDGIGGRSKATRYTLLMLETVTESVTVPHSVTVTDSVSKTVTDSVRGIEETSEHTKGKARKRATTPQGEGKQKHTPEITLEAFLTDCKTKGEKPIAEDDPIFGYAEKAGISDEMLIAAWCEFKDRYQGTGKRYVDWRRHYRNAIKRNWYKLWWIPEGELARWTTAGEQARRAAA